MVFRWKIFPSSKWKQRCISLEIRACKNKWNEMNWKIKGSSGKVLVSLVFSSYVKFSAVFPNFCCFGSLKCHLPWLCYRLAIGSATIESAHFPNLLMLSFPRGTVFMCCSHWVEETWSNIYIFIYNSLTHIAAIWVAMYRWVRLLVLLLKTVQLKSCW